MARRIHRDRNLSETCRGHAWRLGCCPTGISLRECKSFIIPLAATDAADFMPETAAPSATHHHRPEVHGAGLAKLALGAIGVVYGDIGTSPLYALKECVTLPHGVAPVDRQHLRRAVADLLVDHAGRLGEVPAVRHARRQRRRGRRAGADGAGGAAHEQRRSTPTNRERTGRRRAPPGRGCARPRCCSSCWGCSARRCSTATASSRRRSRCSRRSRGSRSRPAPSRRSSCRSPASS